MYMKYSALNFRYPTKSNANFQSFANVIKI